MTTTAKKATAKPAARTTTKAPAKPAPKPGPKSTAPKEPVKATKAAPKEKTSAPLPTSLREALTTRQAVLVKVRGNKTVRSLPYLASGSEERKAAEAVAARVKKGETVPAIAEDLNVSLATARRFLANLALAQAVDAGEHDAAWTQGTKQVIVHTVKPLK